MHVRTEEPQRWVSLGEDSAGDNLDPLSFGVMP